MGRTERHGRSFNWEHGWKGASRVSITSSFSHFPKEYKEYILSLEGFPKMVKVCGYLL